MGLMFDESSAADTRTLIGHSGPIFGVSFSPDKSFLVSGSEDGTGMFHLKSSNMISPLDFNVSPTLSKFVCGVC